METMNMHRGRPNDGRLAVPAESDDVLRGAPGRATTPRLVFCATARSVQGPRSGNQDSGLASSRLVAVADGVGGNVAGRTASALAITSLAEAGPSSPEHDPARQLARTVTAANRRLGEACEELPVLAGMATTLTAAALSGNGHLAVAHIGDSRAYLLRGGQLTALTRDHSVVQAMLEAGSISAEQAQAHPWRSVLLAALRGRDGDLEGLEIATLRVLPGDRLLLCSDGLWAVTRWERIRQILLEGDKPSAAASRLLQVALIAPTMDDVTVIVADVVATTPTATTPTATTVVGAATTAGARATAPRSRPPVAVPNAVDQAT